jgi:hypothetical protein
MQGKNGRSRNHRARTFVRSESWKPHLRQLHFRPQWLMKLETADVRVYIIFEIVTIGVGLRTGEQRADHFLVSNQSEVLTEPWSLLLPRVVTVTGGPDQFELEANRNHRKSFPFVLGGSGGARKIYQGQQERLCGANNPL